MSDKVLLVDGTSHIFRAYHRMGLSLTSPGGQNVGALYTFCLMLKKLLKNHPNSPIVMFFDAGGENFRHEIYEQYKANREKPDQELIDQIELCHQVARKYGFPVVLRKGVEADDLIGTVAKHYSKNYQVEIHSPDKDFMQLVTESIQVVVDEKTHYKYYDPAAVEEKYQVSASVFRDFLALKGDVSDNVPGLKGCGDKTAAKWLNMYGTLDGILKNQDKIKGKIGEKLRAGVELLELSAKLVTIDVNQSWPDELPLDTLPSIPVPLTDQLTEMFELYGFKSLIPEVKLGLDSVKSQVKFHLIDNRGHYDKFLYALRDAAHIAFDLETTSLDPRTGRIIGISFAFDFNSAYYLSLESFDELMQQQIKLDFQDLFREKVWIAHNFKFDAKFLLHHWGLYPENFEDTMIMGYICHASGPFDLKSLSQKHLSWEMLTFDEYLKKHNVSKFEDVPINSQKEYACLDAAATFRLFEHFSAQLEESEELKKLYQSVDRPFVESLVQMESRGVLLDCDFLHGLKESFEKEKEQISEQIFAKAGLQFQISSTKQLREVLFDKIGLPVLVKTPKGLPSTNEDALSQLAHDYEICADLMKWRELDKLLSTYTDSLIEQVNPETKAIHTHYHQTGTVTGRLSSSEPNLQNIPIKTDKGKLIRKAFIAREGYVLIAVDYSQIELRLMAHYSQDPDLLKAYTQNTDIHSLTASKIYGCSLDEVSSSQRRDAKIVNFGLIYGMSPWGLSRQLKVSLDTATDFHQRFFKQYPGVKRYMDTAQEQAKNEGFVKTLLGRRIPIRESNTRRNQNYRAAINGPLQGTASDLIKLAMIALSKKIKNSSDAHLIMQVHDELVLEVRAEKVDSMRVLIEQTMTQALKLTVPLEVQSGTGPNWQEAH